MIKKILVHTPLLLIILSASFYAGLHVHFPSETLQKRVQYEVQKSSRETLFVNIEKTTTKGLGISFSDVQILQKDKKKEEASEVFFSPELNVSVPLMSALSFTPQAYIESEMFGGEVQTYVELKKNNRIKVTPNISGLNAALLPLYGDMWELSFLGSMDLSGNLTFPLNKFKKAKGKIKIKGNNLQLEEGKVLIKTLPPMTFTEVNIDLGFEKGKATVKEGLFSSPELQIDISGHIKLNNAPLKSKLFLTLKVETGEELNKLIGGLGKPYQDDQGVYNIKVLGRVSSPRIQSGKKKSRNSKKRNRAPKEDDEDMSIDPMNDDIPRVQRPKIDDEERDKRRQERIERAKKRRSERINKRKASKNGFDRVMPTSRIFFSIDLDDNENEEGEEPSQDEGEEGTEEESEEPSQDEGEEPSDE